MALYYTQDGFPVDATAEQAAANGWTAKSPFMQGQGYDPTTGWSGVSAQQLYDQQHGPGSYAAAVQQFSQLAQSGQLGQYEQQYGKFPVGDAQGIDAWMKNALTGGARTAGIQDAAAQAGDFIESGGLAKAIIGGIAGAGLMGVAGAAVEGAGGAAAVEGGSASGFGFGSPESLVGAGAEGTMGAGGTGMSGVLGSVDPFAVRSLDAGGLQNLQNFVANNPQMAGGNSLLELLGPDALAGMNPEFGSLTDYGAGIGNPQYADLINQFIANPTTGNWNLPNLPSSLSRLLGGGSGDTLSSLLGGGSGLLGGLGGLANLAGRTAPGLAALAYAGQQKPVDQSGLQGVANAAGQPLPGIDTSQLQALLGRAQQPLAPIDRSGLQSTLQQAQANSPLFVQSMLHPAQQAMARGYGDMLQSQGQRGVRGSSFGDQAISNYLTDQSRTLGDIGAQATQTALGLQGNLGGQLANLGVAERGQQLQQLGLENTAANNLANIGLTQNQQSISKLGVQGNIASQLASLGLQQQAVQNAMYGRAFDILGRGLAPTGQSSFGGGSGGSDIMSLLQSLGLGGP